MRKFSFCIKWLQMMAVILCLLGISLAFLGKTPIFYWLFFAQPYPPFFELETFTEQVVLLGAWNGAMAGSAYTFTGILMLLIFTYAFPKKEKWAYYAIMAGLCIWYAINAGFTVYYKVYFKVIIDTVFFLPVIIPLIIMKKGFRKTYNNEEKIE